MYKRVAELFFLLCLFFGTLCAKMVVISSSGSQAAAYTTNSVSITAAKSRGTIYDCKLRPLVNNSRCDYVAIKPSISALSEVSEIISEQDKTSVYKQISNGKIGIAKATGIMPSDNAVCFSTLNRYEDDGLCVHIIGYTDIDGKGVCGIESYYNSLLEKYSGTVKISCLVDARGNILAGEKIKAVNSSYGAYGGVVLTIDKRIQQICEEALKQFNIEKGAVVVLDSATARIRAIASAPEYSQNDVSQSLNDDNAPFINRAITPYSVGSVFKAVVAAAAIENGIPTQTEFNCNGGIDVLSTHFSCHNRAGHGTVDMYSGMAQSCNPYFISLAMKTGSKAICIMGENLGLGSAVELCDGWYTQAGIMPSEQSLTSAQDLANLAFGQGKLLASPLQMAAVYAAIANGGIYRAPSLMQAIVDENRIEYMRAELPCARRVMSSETAKKVGELLKYTVENGSGAKAKPENISVAGKTATAQSGQLDDEQNEITQSWFCGYFPYEAPEYVITVLKENGQGGSVDCAPVFRYIATKIMTDE